MVKSCTTNQLYIVCVKRVWLGKGRLFKKESAMKRIVGLVLLIGLLSSCVTVGPVVTDIYYCADGSLVMEKTAVKVDNMLGIVVEGNRTIEPVRIKR